MLPVKYNQIFAAWQKRFEAWQRGERPPPYPTRVVTQIGLANIFHDPGRYKEGMARWTEDVMIRAYMENSDWQILYREDSPLHKGFDFVVKNVPSRRVEIVEMKTSKKIGGLRTYLKKTKTKGRQMSLKWVRVTLRQIRDNHPLVYTEVMNAIDNNLLRRKLIVANHEKKPHGWLSAANGNMGMKGFLEDDFRKTSGFD